MSATSKDAFIEEHRKAKNLGDDTVTRIQPDSWENFKESNDPSDIRYATFAKDTRAAQLMLDINDHTDYRWHLYSGRGMMGVYTVGVNVGESNELDEGQVYRATTLSLRSDSMGRGRILYA